MMIKICPDKKIKSFFIIIIMTIRGLFFSQNLSRQYSLIQWNAIHGTACHDDGVMGHPVGAPHGAVYFVWDLLRH
jgi:hypothetical protein